MTTVLGIMDSHLGSACIFQDGEIKAAIAEERMNGVKGYSLFPEKSIKKVMEMTGIKGEDIDVVAVSNLGFGADIIKLQKKESGFGRSLVTNLSRFLPTFLLDNDALRKQYLKYVFKIRKSKFFKQWGKFFEEIGIDQKKIKFYEHHDCHAAAAYYLRPFKEKTLVFTADGEGDGLCGSIWIGENNHLERKITISVLHSLGGMYSRFTKLMGMKPWEHEYKVMGLAPNANVERANKTYDTVKKFMHVEGLKFHNDTGRVGSAFTSYISKQLKFKQFDTIAYSIQKLQEDLFVEWIENAIKHFGIRKIALAGGSFLNVKANKLIAELDSVEDIFIFPAAGDDSCSIGAAILAYNESNNEKEIKQLMNIYFGDSFDDQIEEFSKTIDSSKYKIEMHTDIDVLIGEMLSKNEIVARCSGRMEYGPRSLGNRAILANPKDPETIDKINTMIKYRDFWMPFTPSMLFERSDDYVENPKKLTSHYMVMAFDSRKETRRDIMATVHQADKTTRPQMLLKDWNSKYYSLIKSFEDKTGIGTVLNTSLNLHGSPMVRSPKEAFYTLENSGLRHLALGNYLISKK